MSRRPQSAVLAAAALSLPGVAPWATTEPPPLGAAAIAAAPTTDWAAVEAVDFITPAPSAASFDAPEASSNGCHKRPASGSSPVVCSAGPDERPTIMVAGDSKATQWTPVIGAIANEAGWRSATLVMSGCTLVDANLHLGDDAYADCNEWGPQALEQILAHPPDLLLVSGGRLNAYLGDDPASRSFDVLVEGYARVWQQVIDVGVPVIVLLDNPPPGFQVQDCVRDNVDHLAACGFSFGNLERSGTPALLAAADLVSGVRVIDLNDWICPGREWCPPVIGNVLVYREGSHLTRTYVMTMKPMLADALAEATDGRLV